jgi:hypothetical protein
MLGYLMYRSALVARGMAVLVLIGGPVLTLSFAVILAGVHKNGETPSGILTLPEAAWELALGVYCAWKGFPNVKPARHARSGDGRAKHAVTARVGVQELADLPPWHVRASSGAYCGVGIPELVAEAACFAR